MLRIRSKRPVIPIDPSNTIKGLHQRNQRAAPLSRLSSSNEANMKMKRRHRQLLVVALSIGFFLVEIWIAETGGGFPTYLQIVLVPIAAVATAILVPSRAALRISASFFVVFVLVSCWFVGNHSARAAFNDCVANAEALRVDLAEFKVRQGRYPDSLVELKSPLPCRLIMRRSLLAYRSVGEGYELEFSDWMVTHSATHEQPFLAHK